MNSVARWGLSSGRLLSFGSQSSWRGRGPLEPESEWWNIQQVIAMIHMIQQGAIFSLHIQLQKRKKNQPEERMMIAIGYVSTWTEIYSN